MREGTRVSAVGEAVDLAGVCFSSSAPFVSLRNEVLIECCCSEEMDRFISARDSLPDHLRGFIVPYTVDEYQAKEAKLFLTADERGGFALIHGELASLFSLPGAHYGEMLVREAVERGAFKLSCFDTRGKLPSLYGRHGFTETFRAPWDDAFAPKNWNFAAWGRPEYVEMSR